MENQSKSYEATYWYFTSLWRLGQFEKANSEINPVLGNLESADEYWKAKLFHVSGVINHYLGNHDIALEYFYKSYRYQCEARNFKDAASSLNNIAIILMNRGKLDLAYDHFNKCLEMNIKLGNSREIAISLTNIANIFQIKGELIKAESYHRKSLEIYKDIGNLDDIGQSKGYLAETLFDLGNYQEAMQYYKDCFSLFEEVENHTTMSYFLSVLISRLTIQDREKAKPYLNQLQDLSEINENNQWVNLYYNLSKALYLKSSIRNKDKVKAQEILEFIVKTNDFDRELLMIAINHLTEILLFEYKLYQENEVLEEVQQYINQMYQIAQEQQIFQTLIRTLILNSRLQIIQNNFDKGYILLEQARLIAIENRLEQFNEIIEKEKEQFERQIQELKLIVEESDIIERIERSRIIEYIEKVNRLKS